MSILQQQALQNQTAGDLTTTAEFTAESSTLSFCDILGLSYIVSINTCILQ